MRLHRRMSSLPIKGPGVRQELALGIRSIAAPIRGGSGRVEAALNVTVHAAGTPIDVLLENYLPMLLESAQAISRDWALRDAVPANAATH